MRLWTQNQLHGFRTTSYRSRPSAKAGKTIEEVLRLFNRLDRKSIFILFRQPRVFEKGGRIGGQQQLLVLYFKYGLFYMLMTGLPMCLEKLEGLVGPSKQF